jgi:hypothetical protein
VSVHRDLEHLPAALESAYEEQDDPVKETVNAG